MKFKTIKKLEKEEKRLGKIMIKDIKMFNSEYFMEVYGRLEQTKEIYKMIEELKVNETWCFDCNLGFDEDSDECFRCNGKNIEHRQLEISKEKLLNTLKGVNKIKGK